MNFETCQVSANNGLLAILDTPPSCSKADIALLQFSMQILISYEAQEDIIPVRSKMRMQISEEKLPYMVGSSDNM